MPKSPLHDWNYGWNICFPDAEAAQAFAGKLLDALQAAKIPTDKVVYYGNGADELTAIEWLLRESGLSYMAAKGIDGYVAGLAGEEGRNAANVVNVLVPTVALPSAQSTQTTQIVRMLAEQEQVQAFFVPGFVGK
ncbi:hypothetical protein GC177_08090 [bacterium]|nr:hypothetical protein [bacterium]